MLVPTLQYSLLFMTMRYDIATCPTRENTPPVAVTKRSWATYPESFTLTSYTIDQEDKREQAARGPYNVVVSKIPGFFYVFIFDQEDKREHAASSSYKVVVGNIPGCFYSSIFGPEDK